MTPILPKQAEECAAEFFYYIKERGLLEADLVPRSSDWCLVVDDTPMEFYFIGDPIEYRCTFADGKQICFPSGQEQKIREKGHRVKRRVLFCAYFPDVEKLKALDLPMSEVTKILENENSALAITAQARVKMLRKEDKKISKQVGRRVLRTDAEIILEPLNEDILQSFQDKVFDMNFVLKKRIRVCKEYWEAIIS